MDQKYCVVENNTLDDNITVYACKDHAEAEKLFASIRKDYLSDEGYKSMEEAEGSIIENCDDCFSLHASNCGDYVIRVQILEMYTASSRYGK